MVWTKLTSRQITWYYSSQCGQLKIFSHLYTAALLVKGGIIFKIIRNNYFYTLFVVMIILYAFCELLWAPAKCLIDYFWSVFMVSPALPCVQSWPHQPPDPITSSLPLLLDISNIWGWYFMVIAFKYFHRHFLCSLVQWLFLWLGIRKLYSWLFLDNVDMNLKIYYFNTCSCIFTLQLFAFVSDCLCEESQTQSWELSMYIWR